MKATLTLTQQAAASGARASGVRPAVAAKRATLRRRRALDARPRPRQWRKERCCRVEDGMPLQLRLCRQIVAGALLLPLLRPLPVVARRRWALQLHCLALALARLRRAMADASAQSSVGFHPASWARHRLLQTRRQAESRRATAALSLPLDAGGLDSAGSAGAPRRAHGVPRVTVVAA